MDYYNTQYIAERLPKTMEEKVECLPMLQTLIFYSQLMLTQGCLVVEQESKKETNPLLKVGIQLLVEAEDFPVILHVLWSHLIAGNYKGKEFLEGLLIMDTIYYLRRGSMVNGIATVLFGWFGAEFHEAYWYKVEDFRSENTKRLKELADYYMKENPEFYRHLK